VLARIAQEQGASVEKLRGRGLPSAGELREFGAFRLRECDFVSISHAGEKSSKAKFAMRKYKCYEILATRAGFEILPKKNLMPEPFPATLASELERLRTKRQQRPSI
jgi:hypothetical protein